MYKNVHKLESEIKPVQSCKIYSESDIYPIIQNGLFSFGCIFANKSIINLFNVQANFQNLFSEFTMCLSLSS